MGKEIVSNRISLKDFKGIASIGIGGTGDNTAKEARNSLRIVGRADHNTMNGVAGLDEYGMLKDEQIPEDLFSSGHALNGPKQIVVGSTTNVYRVTYWSDFRDIQVTIDNYDASMYLDGNGQVVIDAPSTPGIMMLTITGSYNDEIYCNKSFPIDVVANTDHVNTPSIVSPVSGAANLGPDVTFTSSSFGVSSGSDTHEGSDWQLATDAGFTSIVASVTNSASDKTNWTVTGLLPATQYYVRTRYKGTDMGHSNWSTTASFTTKASYIPNTEEAILSASDKAPSDYFGYSIAFSNDASRVIIGSRLSDYNTYTNLGAAYIFRKDISGWVQEAKLLPNVLIQSYYFGCSVDITATGDRVIVGASAGASDSVNGAYIFSRSGTTWSQEIYISPSDRGTGANVGSCVSITSDGSRVAIGAEAYDNGTNDTGIVYIYSRSGTTWTQEAKKAPSDPASYDSFGHSLSLDSTGTRLVVGAYYKYISGTSGVGKVYVFIRSGTTWTQEVAIVPSSIVASTYFGYSVDISGNGDRIVIGAWGGSGAIYIYFRTGSSWNLETTSYQTAGGGGSQYGKTVSINDAGDKVVVAAPAADISGFQDSGDVYLYTRSGTTWSLYGNLVASNRAANDNFGHHLRISGDGSKIAVTNAQKPDTSFSGTVHIYS